MELVIDWSEGQQAHSGIGNTGGPGWHWDLSGTTYHLPDMQIDYDIGGIVDPVVERMHSLGEFQSAPAIS